MNNSKSKNDERRFTRPQFITENRLRVSSLFVSFFCHAHDIIATSPWFETPSKSTFQIFKNASVLK